MWLVENTNHRVQCFELWFVWLFDGLWFLLLCSLHSWPIRWPTSCSLLVSLPPWLVFFSHQPLLPPLLVFSPTTFEDEHSYHLWVWISPVPPPRGWCFFSPTTSEDEISFFFWIRIFRKLRWKDIAPTINYGITSSLCGWWKTPTTG